MMKLQYLLHSRSIAVSYSAIFSLSKAILPHSEQLAQLNMGCEFATLLAITHQFVGIFSLGWVLG